MATAYYFAAHGAHFPMVHTDAVQPPSPPSTNPMLSVYQHTPTIPATAPIKLERNDSVVSPALPADTMNSQLESLFFRLPAELRNQIYEELLCANTPTKLSDLAKASRLQAPAPTHPAILSTCKRIHAEAADLLYTTHVFHAHPSLLTSLPHLMTTSKPVLYPTVLGKIKRWQLTLRLDTDPRFTAQQATAAFSGAEFLELKVWQSMFDGCNAAVLKLFTGVRGLLLRHPVADFGIWAKWPEGFIWTSYESAGGSNDEPCNYERRKAEDEWTDDRSCGDDKEMDYEPHKGRRTGRHAVENVVLIIG
ncbi:hypothetical protein SLS59_006772 [Nothophoma quercina]|uniref:F-box domain-containing protein n=1 Tax=Nothophoma quercina TaxID=749835 RepID=A0ABR3R2J4_9PLEO